MWACSEGEEPGAKSTEHGAGSEVDSPRAVGEGFEPGRGMVSAVSKPFLVAVLIGLVSGLWPLTAGSQEVPYTLADRDRLIRVEATLQEFKQAVDHRFEAVEQRFASLEKRFEGRFESVEGRFESIEKRFESVEKRLERLESVMLGGFGLLFTSMIGLVGFVLWDRRSALAPAIRKNKELEEQGEQLKRALRELAQHDPHVAEALKHVGLL